jgi:hypothetical protein
MARSWQIGSARQATPFRSPASMLISAFRPKYFLSTYVMHMTSQIHVGFPPNISAFSA